MFGLYCCNPFSLPGLGRVLDKGSVLTGIHTLNEIQGSSVCGDQMAICVRWPGNFGIVSVFARSKQGVDHLLVVERAAWGSVEAPMVVSAGAEFNACGSGAWARWSLFSISPLFTS